jgi:hypothetical protein
MLGQTIFESGKYELPADFRFVYMKMMRSKKTHLVIMPTVFKWIFMLDTKYCNIFWLLKIQMFERIEACVE